MFLAGGVFCPSRKIATCRADSVAVPYISFSLLHFRTPSPRPGHTIPCAFARAKLSRESGHATSSKRGPSKPPHAGQVFNDLQYRPLCTPLPHAVCFRSPNPTQPAFSRPGHTVPFHCATSQPLPSHVSKQHNLHALAAYPGSGRRWARSKSETPPRTERILRGPIGVALLGASTKHGDP